MSIFTIAFWAAAGERAIKTAAQAAILSIGAQSIVVNALAVDWLTVGGFALGGASLSILTSVGSGLVTGNPSLTNAEVLPDNTGE